MTTVTSAARQFRPANIHLDTASLGLGPLAATKALSDHLDQWTQGRCDVPGFDAIVDRSRAHAATIMGTSADRVAIVSQVAVTSGVVAQSLPNGSRVTVAADDFTSVLFPFLQRAERGELTVDALPLEELIDAVAAGTDAVAVSAVQSADGRRLDLDALADAAGASGAFSFVDATQSAGWVPMNADRFDVVATGAYKWLCCPRGTGFMTASDRAIASVPPILANWYAGADRWNSVYRAPLRLAHQARRFDVSPAWPVWVGAEPSLALLASVGPAAIGHHNVALANRFRSWLDLGQSNSAIVSVEADANAADRLRGRGINFAGRDGRLRLSFHLYNTVDDADVAAKAVKG